jgi:hypothetical protein
MEMKINKERNELIKGIENRDFPAERIKPTFLLHKFLVLTDLITFYCYFILFL